MKSKSVFGSVVAGAFQITFRAEMHANDFFYFLKIIFDISTSKRSKKYKLHSILAKKKKNSNFHKTQVETHYQTLPKTSFFTSSLMILLASGNELLIE
jgi:hypothetical protein